MRTLNIDLMCAQSDSTYEGGILLEIIGRTSNDVSHKIVLKLAPSAIGYLGAELHRGLKKLQDKLDAANADLKGENL